MDGQYWKVDRTMSTNEWLLTSDFWQFLEPWHGRWYKNEIFIASCTDNIYDLENERWLFGDMIDHVGIYGSRVTEGLSAFNVGLVQFRCSILAIYTKAMLLFRHNFIQLNSKLVGIDAKLYMCSGKSWRLKMVISLYVSCSYWRCMRKRYFFSKRVFI